MLPKAGRCYRAPAGADEGCRSAFWRSHSTLSKAKPCLSRAHAMPSAAAWHCLGQRSVSPKATWCHRRRGWHVFTTACLRWPVSGASDRRRSSPSYLLIIPPSFSTVVIFQDCHHQLFCFYFACFSLLPPCQCSPHLLFSQHFRVIANAHMSVLASLQSWWCLPVSETS